MRLLLTAMIAVLSATNPAAAFWGDPLEHATKLGNFGIHEVYRSIQCEIGQFGRYAAQNKVPMASALQAQYAFTQSIDVSSKVSFNAELGIKIAQILSGPGVTLSLEQITNRTKTSSDSLNVNTDNVGKWCRGIVPVEVYSCLVDARDNLLTGKAKCSSTVTAHGVLSANGKFIIWYINVGPGFDYDVKQTYTISIEAPPPKDK